MANRVKGSNAKKPREEQSKHELLESPDALRESLTGPDAFLSKKKNQRLVLGVATVIALAVAAFFGYKYYMNNQDKLAQEEMFQAIFYFEADSLNKALNGDGNNYGFLEIIDEYGGTDAANLAHFYAGVSYLKQGEYQSAIDQLKDFSASDYLLQARADALTGDAHMELKQYDQAVGAYKKAADYKPNQYFTPGYLEKEAVAYEAKQDYTSAAQSYQRIIDDFPSSEAYQNALKQHARLEQLSAEKK